MLERSKWILKIACLLLAAVLLYQLVQIGIRLNPLSHVKIPELPSLPPETNNQPAPGPAMAAMPPVPAAKASNSPSQSVPTNASSAPLATGTNVALPKPANTGTNPSPSLPADAGTTNASPALASAGSGTNLPSPTGGTNIAALRSPGSPTAVVAPGTMPMAMPGRSNPNQRMMMSPPQAASLPPAIQARVDRIVESEILGPFIRPQPAALIGIAGNFAFVRAPTGQTGLVKEGDDLGGIKLLRIGINRVLIEEQGQKKELTIFSGYGGESLLPKQDTSHETNK
jgi:hypothetical protein